MPVIVQDLIKNELNANSPQRAGVRYRAIWMIAALMYPIWAIIFANFISEPRQVIVSSGVVVTVLILALTLVRFSTWAASHIRIIHSAIAWILTGYYFSYVMSSGLTGAHGLAIFVVVVATMASFSSWKETIPYGVFVSVMLSIIPPAQDPIIDQLLYFGLVTLFVIHLLSNFDRFRIINSLLEREVELKHANDKTVQILQSIKEGFATLDRDYRITYGNRVAEAIIGKPLADCVGRSIWDIFPQAEDSPFHETYRKAMNGEHAELQEYYAPLDVWFEIRAYPNENGISIFFRNITERKRMESAISDQRMKTAVASKLATLGEMAGGIAHEINNPLAIIQLKAQQLKEAVTDGDVSADEVNKAADKIESTAIRIAKIVKALKSISRDGNQDPFVTVPVRSIIDETIELCHERFKNNGVKLVYNPATEAMKLECRPVQISQVLLNLVANAFDSVASLPQRWVLFTTRKTASRFT